MMQLIYRGQIYNYTPAEPKAYVKPRALNWRYQIAGEAYEGTTETEPETVEYVHPRAINWRYQMYLSI